MRVLVATHYYDHAGGIERIAAEIAARLQRRGVEVSWTAAAPAPAELPAHPLPVRVLDTSERRWGLPFPVPSPRDLGRLAARIRQFDLVHLHECFYLANQAVYAAARWAEVPVVVTQHVAPIPYRRALPRAAMWLLARLTAPTVLGGADRCVFYSDSVQRTFAEMVRFTHPPRRIDNGVDLARFRPAGEEERHALRRRLGLDDGSADAATVLFVGRFVEKKGLRWMRHLIAAFPAVRFVMAGAGPLDPRGWGLANLRVQPFMAHDELAELYRAADLLLLPSFGEGFPLVVQEAMACGTPALVSDEVAAAVPGFAEVAFTAPLAEVALERALAAALATLSPQRRAATARWAAARWDWERCTDDYLALFHEVAPQRQGRPG